MNSSHFAKIINGYKSAPINQLFNPKIRLSLGKSEIEIEVKKDFHHSANSLHGSIYFKMLDDAAWSASNTYIEDVLLFTYSFTVYLIRPVSSGIIKSVGKVKNRSNKKITAESTLYDSDGAEIGKGSGVFMRSEYLLKDAIGFNAK